MFSNKPETAWDVRTWVLGFLLGNFAGLLLLFGGYPPLRQPLETAFPYSVSGYYTGDFVRLLGLICGGLVLPAFLVSTAKRCYFLWGLLPLVLLTAWIIAGKIVSHDLDFLANPVFAFPLAFLLCWLISSLPISLFRTWRRCRPPVAKSRMLSEAKHTPKPAGLAACIALFLALILLGWHNFRHPVHTSATMRIYWPPDKKVTVPLIKQGQLLYVQAQLNGQNILCKVDTGAENVEWSRGLHLGGRLTQWNGQTCDILGNCVGIHTIILPQFKIGGYEIENLPTDMSDVDAGLFSPPSGPADEAPNLGNPAFVKTVLTIDYKDAVMTLRPSEYNFAQQQRKPGDRILEMGWTSHYSDKDWRRSFYGTPSIMAVINGFSFWCTLDTGAGGPEIGLTKNLVESHLSRSQAKRRLAPLNAANSSALVPHLDGLDVFFPCAVPPHAEPLSLKLNGLVTPSLKTDEVNGNGVIGLPLMQRYRITIDYPRGRVLLEPYARN